MRSLPLGFFIAASTAALLTVATVAEPQSPPIIQNPAPNPDAPAFRLSAQPVFQVGGLNNDPNYELIWPPADVEVTPSGKFLVAPADGRTAPVEVRVFGADGKFERKIGRRGDGPGEFSRIERVWTLQGDSIAVFDPTKRRVSVFDAHGNYGRTITGFITGGSGGQGAFISDCCFDDWSFLATSSPTTIPRSERQTPRDSVNWFIGRAGSSTSARQILRLQNGDPSVVVGTGPGGRGTLSMAIPFGRAASVEITGSEIVYGLPDSYEFRVYSQSGIVNRIVRADVPARPVTRAHLDYLRQNVGRGANDPNIFRSALERLTLPTTLPAYLNLLTERDGTVWVREFDYGAPRQTWTRFDSAGRMLGTLQIPSDQYVERFTRGHVVLRKRDSSSQSTTIAIYRIERRGE